LYCAVDTPRAASASVGSGDDYAVASLGDFTEQSLREWMFAAVKLRARFREARSQVLLNAPQRHITIRCTGPEQS
jgi:hypothetical protein